MDQAQLTDKLGWLNDDRSAVAEWSELLQLAATTEDDVRKEGYHRGAPRRLRSRLKPLATCKAGRHMRNSLLTFVGAQSSQADKHERLPGSSEVIESLIGKYKRLQSTHSKGGMTAMLLSFGAIVLDKTTETIQRDDPTSLGNDQDARRL